VGIVPRITDDAVHDILRLGIAGRLVQEFKLSITYMRSETACSVNPHGFTAVVPLVSSAQFAEACPPSPRLRRTPVRIPSRLNNHGFLRRRVKLISAFSSSPVSSMVVDHSLAYT
jgi:hypothetical protein